MRALLHPSNSTYHPRRSLDQYYYSKLPDTTQRDRDQVVSKYMKDLSGEPKMIMVDQLWLWILATDRAIEEPGADTTVFTCFASKEQENEMDTQYTTADLRQSIYNDVTETTNVDGVELAAIILRNAVKGMFQVRTDPTLNFFEIFREAISQTVRP